MRSNKDIIIIGGGIVGLACAHYLLNGHKSVRIIEQDQVGSGASHGNCGLLHFSGIIPLCSPGTVSHELIRAIKGTSPLYIKPRIDFSFAKWLLCFARSCSRTKMMKSAEAKNRLLKYSQNLFRDLFEKNELACDLEKKGLLTLFRSERYFEKYASTNEFLSHHGFGGKRILKNELKKMEPAAKNDVIGAFFNPHDWHLRPEHLVQSWKKVLVNNDLFVEENSKAVSFETNLGKIKTVHTTKGSFDADYFVLASGAWTPSVQKSLDLKIPVQPGKGYSITMHRPESAPSIPCLLYERNMVATPWESGYRLGGTMEFSGHSDTLNRRRLEKLITGASEYLETSTRESRVEEWTGLRPMTSDDLPILGRPKTIDNLIIAAGHGMLGVTMATGTGKIVADLIASDQADIDISDFSPDRF